VGAWRTRLAGRPTTHAPPRHGGSVTPTWRAPPPPRGSRRRQNGRGGDDRAAGDGYGDAPATRPRQPDRPAMKDTADRLRDLASYLDGAARGSVIQRPLTKRVLQEPEADQ
jgi:hypothetical protein